METTYRVSGMTCGGCEKSVVRALERVGVKAEANASEGTAVVRGEHDPKAVRAAIEAAGFELT